MPELRLEGVSKYYKVDRRKRMAVQDIDLTIEQGEFVFLNGSSGAGKSTILRLLGGDLTVTWDREADLVYMTGPATTVFEGEI